VNNKKHGIGKLSYKEKGEYYGTLNLIQANGKMESSMAKEHTRIVTRIAIRAGGNSGKSTAKAPTLTLTQA
jgi:hypothetical protein